MPQEAGGVALMGEESPDGCSMLGMVIVPFPGEGLVPGSLGDSSPVPVGLGDSSVG